MPVGREPERGPDADVAHEIVAQLSGVELGLAPSHHKNLCVLRRKTLGSGEADSSGVTCDDRDLAFESACHDLSPCWQVRSVAKRRFSK